MGGLPLSLSLVFSLVFLSPFLCTLFLSPRIIVYSICSFRTEEGHRFHRRGFDVSQPQGLEVFRLSWFRCLCPPFSHPVHVCSPVFVAPKSACIRASASICAHHRRS